MSYSDPYGLKICADRAMRRRIEQTYQMEIGWDSNGCADKNTTLRRLAGSASHAELQDEFIYVVRSGLNIEVSWRDRGGSFFNPPANFFDDADIGISWRQAYEPYGIESNGRSARVTPWGVHALIAHEFGHANNFLKREMDKYKGPRSAPRTYSTGPREGRPGPNAATHKPTEV